ncbi:hypothetical protein O4328_42975 [Rhodococcus opacus]|uniref:Uncharacterized protein n=1 Tax=Rhodococcus opacus TaxID=37919 RepID=A0AAX3YSX6_RHOOP|nr:hypothetical protein [Rhodococcus opacus]MCZ4590307.1 hypothetical protein [Rhodococcus opacus]WLF51585.1 hypothetical protein Q5707_39390 [Rhodococcus opacus]WLF52618.1 hypothetical protein Q5707_45605 [Rhodococcus opacus]
MFADEGRAAGVLLGAIRGGTILIAPGSGQDGSVSDRTAADLERELAMLADVRDRLRASEGADFQIPTTAVDQVLDELNSLEPSPVGSDLIASVRTGEGPPPMSRRVSARRA